MLTGGCLCGAVQYQLTAEALYPPTLCHCRSCQRASGAHAVAWVTVPVSALRYLGMQPSEVESSPGARRCFCGRCGSPLTYWNAARSDEIDVTLCTLDDPGALAPADQIWTQDAVPWESSAPVLTRWRTIRGR